MNLCGRNDRPKKEVDVDAATSINYHEYAHLINVLLKQGRLGEVEQELHKIFEKGYSYGLNNGWAIEQDRDDGKANGHKGSF